MTPVPLNVEKYTQLKKLAWYIHDAQREFSSGHWKADKKRLYKMVSQGVIELLLSGALTHIHSHYTKYESWHIYKKPHLHHHLNFTVKLFAKSLLQHLQEMAMY